MSKSKFELNARLKSFVYAWNGVRLLMKEHNMRIHLAATAIVIALGLILGLNSSEWVLIALCIGLVICSEAFNTAIEHLADIVQPEHDPKIGKIKDIAAGAVLLAAVIALIVGLLIFIPHIRRLLS